VPIWSVPGNMKTSALNATCRLVEPDSPVVRKGMYRQRLGPNYYSFQLWRVHFVGLDFGRYPPTFGITATWTRCNSRGCARISSIYRPVRRS